MSHQKRVKSSLNRNFIVIVALVAIVLLIAACSPPGAKSTEEATPVSFEPTPYQAEMNGQSESGATDEAAVADEAEAENEGETEGETGGADAATVDESNPESTAPLLYKGEIMPENRVTVVAETSGMVLALNAEVSDVVSAGDVLAVIDSAMLEAQRAQALAGLQAAQAQLDLLLDTASDEDMEAARAGVTAAGAAYQRALDSPTAEDERMALAGLKQAEAAVTVAQAGYNRVKGNPQVGAMPESMQLQQATLAVEGAQAQYDKVLNGATSDIIAGAYAQLAQARAQLQRLEDGAKDAQIEAAEAQVMQAETALYLAQLQLDKAVVESTVDGIIIQVQTAEGAMLAPGAPVTTLRSENVKIIVAVEENRMQEVEIGQAAEIQVGAYPGRVFNGEVTIIAPELNPATRTVAVTIEPTEDAADLAPGMFASVELLK